MASLFLSPTVARAISGHTYGVRAIAGDVPVFFTVIAIFDGSIFTRFGWFRAFPRNVPIYSAVITNCTVWTIAGNMTLQRKTSFIKDLVFIPNTFDFYFLHCTEKSDLTFLLHL